MRISDAQAFAAAIAGGAVLWQLTAIVAGRREAWDSSLYWLLAYPAGLVLAGALAYLHPHRPWRFALAMMWVQPVMMVIFGAGDFSLLPLGLIMFGVLAVPPIGVAYAASSLRLKRRE